MPLNTKSKGTAGETAALAFLAARGYQIIDCNVRPEGGMARGELDAVAWHGETLVFVEVKTRRTARGQQGAPSEAIDARKRRQLARLAELYLAQHALDDVPCRFDVVEAIPVHADTFHFALLPDAFRGDE